MDRLARHVVAPLLFRLALAAVFIFHGMEKLEKEWGTAWNPQMGGALQTMVAWGEFLGGVALALGFLSRVAALGIIGIMVGAIITVTGENGFSLMNHGYEYNVVLIALASGVVLLGPGPVSLDRLLWGSRDNTPGVSR